jgi:hypothetical protein
MHHGLSCFTYIKVCIEQVEGIGEYETFNADLNCLALSDRSLVREGRLLKTFMPK